MALIFNGTSDYVDLGNSSLINPTGDMTICAWVYFNSVAADQWVVARDDDVAGRSFAFGCATSGGAHLDIQVGGSVKIGVGLTLTAGIWCHIAATGPTGNWIGYLNGVSNTSGISGALASTTASTTIGKRTYSGFNDWTGGKIAHVAMYGAVLTANEITLLASGVSPLGVRASSLLGYWPLRGAQGSPDLGPNGLFGKISGAAPESDPPFIMPFPRRILSLMPAEGEMPALFLAAAGGFKQAWARNSNLPVLGTGTY